MVASQNAGSERRLLRVLDADPDLGQGLRGEALALARRHLVAETRTLPPGPWRPPGRDAQPGMLGLLVVEGLLTRSTRVGSTACAELLGVGDLLRPWQEDSGWGLLGFEAEWAVLEPARLALLDRRFAAVAGRWPEVHEQVVARSVLRSRRLAFHMAISSLTRVDARVLALLWYLSERWGRVRPDGIAVPLRLTQDTLARLVGARRPSVTTALGELTRAGRLTRLEGGGWLLAGDPPEDVRALRELAEAGPQPVLR